MQKIDWDSKTPRILRGFPAKSLTAHMNLQIIFLGMLDHWIQTNKVKADGGPEWPTLKETRVDISSLNPR